MIECINILRVYYRAVYLCGHDSLWLLMRTFANGDHPFTVMSPAVQRDMIAGLLSCANGSRRDQYLNEVCCILMYYCMSYV